MKFLYSKILLMLLVSIACFSALKAQPSRQQLIDLLGKMPVTPKIEVDTLEKISMGKGWRYKIKYLAEDSDLLLHTPKDFIEAYLFIPAHKKGERLPAIVAIHQDGNHNYLGKSEVAGLGGDADQHYGLELFERGYVVICPDRFLHGPRRRIAKPDTLADVFEIADKAEQHRCGQLLMEGRNFIGKEVYDLILTTNVLYSCVCVDSSRIGAIGHSAGGNVLAYFMFIDKRIKVGVSSCGVFEMANWYDEHAIMKHDAMIAIPGFEGKARTADYIAQIAPRPFLITRGLHEWGDEDDLQKKRSLKHLEETKQMEKIARRNYQRLSADSNLKTIYFDEEGGRHSFPALVKKQAYLWLDQFLKK